jgi:hypothetical protein
MSYTLYLTVSFSSISSSLITGLSTSTSLSRDCYGLVTIYTNDYKGGMRVKERKP